MTCKVLQRLIIAELMTASFKESSSESSESIECIFSNLQHHFFSTSSVSTETEELMHYELYLTNRAKKPKIENYLEVVHLYTDDEVNNITSIFVA